MRKLWWKLTLTPGWYLVRAWSGREWVLQWNGDEWSYGTVKYHPKLIGKVIHRTEGPKEHKPVLNIGGL